MEFIEAFLEPNRFSRPQTPMDSVQALIIHYVGYPGAKARDVRNYFNNLPRINANNNGSIYASSHYIVGLDGEVIYDVPESEVAYHAGGRHYSHTAQKLFYNKKRRRVWPHDRCIGIEVCHPDETGEFLPATRDALVNLSSEIVLRHGIPRENVLRHYDVTGKLCPKFYVEHSNEWENLVDDIMFLAEELRGVS